jgi:hypothetical protein
MSSCVGHRLASRIALRRGALCAWWRGISVPTLATKVYGHKSLPFLIRLPLSHCGGTGASDGFCNAREVEASLLTCRPSATDGGRA